MPYIGLCCTKIYLYSPRFVYLSIFHQTITILHLLSPEHKPLVFAYIAYSVYIKWSSVCIKIAQFLFFLAHFSASDLHLGPMITRALLFLIFRCLVHFVVCAKVYEVVMTFPPHSISATSMQHLPGIHMQNGKLFPMQQTSYLQNMYLGDSLVYPANVLIKQIHIDKLCIYHHVAPNLLFAYRCLRIV